MSSWEQDIYSQEFGRSSKHRYSGCPKGIQHILPASLCFRFRLSAMLWLKLFKYSQEATAKTDFIVAFPARSPNLYEFLHKFELKVVVAVGQFSAVRQLALIGEGGGLREGGVD